VGRTEKRERGGARFERADDWKGGSINSGKQSGRKRRGRGRDGGWNSSIERRRRKIRCGEDQKINTKKVRNPR